jgi:hypothetical protein
MIRLIAVAAFALAAATSAQAMTLAPLHQSDGMRTQAQHVGYRHRGVARGYGVFRPYGYGVWPFRSGVAGRQVRRCALWGAGDVCRRWYY